ncbi:flagellar biosynthetic protein FliR [Crassaminicella profunda]|uniref:flagellar biosynthetic protein FliR n=1 Tax=Crassaminicella profunda TaxID=1286698 RepID=UPI001CA7B5A4|nr:flagellar biosynthetic protein FliR [Crassaminicella profunda]QZY56765.1 flagellar type III secretion system protein FliR [Crassaminicella profunda]
MKIVLELLEHIDVFLLVFSRIIGIFVSAPVFNHKNVPIYLKIGFSFIVTLILFPVIKVPINLVNDQFYLLMGSSIKELLTGIMIGFICYLFYSSIYLAGRIIDMQIGFAMVSVINPQDDTQVPLMGSLFYIMAVLVFLSTNGHHTLIYALKYSFDSIPLGGLTINAFMIDKLIGILINTFIIAFKMGAPVLVAILVSNMLLGILARTMPQMNVFVVGMPLKIIVGLIIIVLMIPLYVGVFENIFEHMFENLYEFLNLVLKG